MTKEFKVRTWLWVVLATVVILGGGFTYWNAKGSKEVAKTITSPTASQSSEWKTYKNARVNYGFEYPVTGLEKDLEETIKYPSTREGDSKTQDLVQFAANKITYSIQTEVGVTRSTIEDWIKDVSVSHADSDLTKYTKITIGSKTAYTHTGDLLTYILANGNVYIIKGMEEIAPSKKTGDIIYQHLLNTLKFQ
ncbi:MAG: hypothetical protein WCV58_00055 [Patescibacteria group bacterium]|jgi:hypothetical protein